MKKSFVASLVMTVAALVAANSAFATATVTTNVTTMSADNAATGGSGAYTAVTGPVLTEANNRDITNGTIILTVSTNFQFNTGSAVSVAVTRNSGTSGLVGLLATVTVTASNITATVTNQDASGTTSSVLTWSGIQVRPLLGTPLATNTVTMSTASTATILGITKGTTSFGQFRETIGAVNKLGYTTAPAATNTAGVALTNVVIQVQDQFGNFVSSNNVAVGLTLNTGAFASGSTNANTGAGGSATFSNLVMNTAGNYTLTASAPATSLSNSLAAAFTVVPAAPSTILIPQDAPPSIFSGVTFPSNVTVQVTDSFGNGISNKTVSLILLSGAPLSGTTSQPSDGNGSATFGGLSVNQSGSQNLVASIGSPSLSVTGATFTVNAGFASQLGYTMTPAVTTTAGVTMASVVVQIEDQAGNAIASNGVPIMVTLNVGGFTSGTTTVNTAPDGSATFSDLLIDASGNYTLTASAAGTTFTSTAAAPFSISPATPSVIQITQDAPSSTTAGTVFSPAVTVLITDSLNNPVSNKTVSLSLLGGGTLNGTVSQPTAANGVATFGDLNITVPGASYALVANSVNSLSATGNTFVVTAAAASKLVYSSVPATTNTAGSTLSTFTVQITDPYGNAIPTNGVPITMGLASGAFASGTPVMNSDVNGTATFTDLVITNAGNNTLTASASGLTSANDVLVILPATYAMTFQQDAPSPATAGVTFSPAVAVRIADPYNNFLTNKTVTLSLLGGGALNGTLSQATAANGVASFGNLSINAIGTNYSLVAAISSPSLTVTGATFTVNAAPASKLVYTSVPATTNIAGSTLSAFTVQIVDSFNNNILTNGVPITMSLSNGTFASGTTPVNTTGGAATFSDLVITNAGNNTLTASASGLTSTNKALVILPTTYAIAFQQDAPAVTNAGAVFTPAVVVKIADQFNNVFSNQTVTLSLLNGGGPLNGTLSQTTTTNGVATFSNLSINVAGTNYALVANSVSSLSVTGNTFVVTNAAPTKLAYTSTPATTNVAGSTLSSFGVQVQDQFNNSVPTNGLQITMTLSNGTFASGTTITNTASDGSVSVGDLVITNAGNNRVTASAAGLASINKVLVITPATLSIAFQQDAPSVTNAGAVFTPAVAVRLADQFNNVIGSRTVTLSLLNGGGPLNGTLSQTTATNGVASFNNLNITVPGTNYALVAVSTNSLSVTGQTFTVTVAPASKLMYTTLPPTSTVAGVTLSTFVVQIEDQFSNNILTGGAPITVNLGTGTFGSGTTNIDTDVDGSATFFDLAINNVGTYTMTATSTGLTSAARLITVVPNVANTLAFIQQPPAVTNAGAVFSPVVTAKVIDQFNNPINGMPVIISLNGAGTLNGTLARTTAATGIATFTGLSVPTPGTGYSLTVITTNPALSATSSNFNINVGALDHYAITASSPLTRSTTPFGVTVTAQDAASNTVNDSSTVVTMSANSLNAQFDANGDSTYGDNTQTLSNGTFTINTRDNFGETVIITATDASNKTGSASIAINAAGGDYRSISNGTWSAAIWQTWNGSSWVSTGTPPAGGAGTNITIQSVTRVTNNVSVALLGSLINQGTMGFSAGGSISVGSGGLVQNSGTIGSSATTLIFNSGGTYQHTEDSGTIPTAAYNANSLVRITGTVATPVILPTTGLNGNVEWNSPNQTAADAIILSAATTIGGDFNIVSTGSGSIIGGGSTARNLTVGGNMNVLGGAYNGVGGNGSAGSGLSLALSVAQNLTVGGGTLSLVVAENTGTIAATLTVGGNLAVNSGNLTIVTGNSSTLSSSYSMTVSGNTSVAGGTVNLTDSTGGSTGGVTVNLRGNLTISGGTIGRASTLPATVNFAGTLPETYSKSAGAITGAVNFAILQGATVNFGTSLLDGSTGTFVLNAGGAIGLGDPAGITTNSPAGNIRVSGTRTYSTGANYIYNGPASQVTSNGLPATVNSLTVSNTGGVVTLGSNVSITSNLTVSAGTFDLGSFTANRATSGGTITVANGATLNVGGTNPFPSNYLNRVLTGGTVVYEGSAQNVAALPYGSLITSGSGTKSLLTGTTTLAGDLIIGSGTTFNAVTNSFSIAGNLTNNGTAFSFSGPQTVTFTGSGTQNVSGASATAFNTFAIGTNSVINLDDNDTALEFTIAGLDQTAGTWGSTASGAANLDDTNFLGLGTLNVTPPTFGIAFLQDAPAVTSAGTVFSPAVVVQLTSSATNLIANQAVALTLNGGGTLGGASSVLSDTNGVATFTNLFINVAGTNYSLTASITSPSLSVTGNTFVVTAAAATKLVYTAVPAAVTNVAGSTVSNFVVQVEDSLNNPVPTNGVPITMSLASGTFASGTTTLFTGPDGSATSTDLVITNAGNNTVTAAAAGLTSATKALVILPAPYAIAFQQDAPTVTNAGAIFSPAVAVKIADAFNNVLGNRIVTLSLLNGGVLGGSTVRTTAVSGVASFTNLFITVPGTNYALVAVSTNSLSVTGQTFTVTTAPASKLIYTVLPPATVTAGATLTSFTVQVTDQFNNNIATNGVPITMSLSNSAFASGTTTSNSDVNGSASFSDLVITNAGNRILVASAPGLTSTNRAITVSPDVANSTIAFVQGPAASIPAGSVFTNTVQIVDEFNNGVSNATIALTPNGFATLNGTLSRATAGTGLATFTNLSVNTLGSNFFITATSGSLSTNSSLFNVTAGAIHHYVVSAGTSQARGIPFNVTVTAQDIFSNTVPDSSTVVTMSGSTSNVLFDANGDSIFGDNTNTLSNGTFTISTKDTTVETMTITAKDANNKTGVSPTITVGAAPGDFRTFQTGLWSTNSTWQTWNGAAWVSATTTPAGGAGTNITILSTHTVTNDAAVNLLGTLFTQGGLSFTNSGSIAVGSGGVLQNSGTVVSLASNLIFNAGAQYQHNFTTTLGSIPISTWNTGATLAVIGYNTASTLSVTAGTGWNQAFQNVIWNCPSQAAAFQLNSGTVSNTMTNVLGNLTIVTTGSSTLRFNALTSAFAPMVVNGDFTLQTGNFDIGSGSAVNKLFLGGNYLQNGGSVQESGSSGGNIFFTGVNKTFTRNSGTIVVGDYNFITTNGASLTLNSGFGVGSGAGVTVLGGTTLNCGTNVINGAGSISINAGATLGIGHPSGITSGTAAIGNIQLTGTRTFNTTGIYVYNGAVSQVTSNGLPATVSSLIISNTGGIVTLSSNVGITSNLTVSVGTFDLGSFSANRTSNGGSVTVANGATLNIGGTNPFPTNYVNDVLGTNSTVVYEGAAQNVAALPYGNLATTGSSTKTLQSGATTLAGALTIGSGTTFAAGANSFSIAGNWSNNGNGFTASGAQTVTFNGASPQTLGGAFATAFNNVAINTGSVLNLAINGSTAQLLSIGGVNQPAGTWGATGSGAANIDNIDFQGTGTLNVLTSLTSPSTTTVTTSGSPSTYGQPVTFTATVTGTGPAATGTVTFMAGANTLGTQALSGSPTGTAAFVTGALVPGTYTITAVYGGDVNFLASSNSVAQEVDVALLTITANNVVKTYGQTVSFAGTEFTASGLTNGDTVTSVTLTSGGTASNAPATNYSIIPSAAVGTGLANYTISYQNGTLTVNQEPVTGSITASNKVYDGTTAATISGYSLATVLFGDDATLTGGTANFSDQTVGNGKTVTATGLTLTGSTAGNYVLTSSNATTTADITAASLAISADNKTKTAGLPNPPLTATYVGFVGGDDTNALTTQATLSTTATDSSPIGTYPITASGAVATNYTISYNDGTLTVVAVPQIFNPHVSGNLFIFSFPTITNDNYQVESKNDLTTPTWTPVGSLIPGTGSSITVTNTISDTKLFYRVDVSPAPGN